MKPYLRGALVIGAVVVCSACVSPAARSGPRPGLLRLYGEPAQRYTMMLMLRVAAANAEARIETGQYAASLRRLHEMSYLEEPILNDAWGNAFTYSTGADTYTIASFGSDGAAGPAPPPFWEFGDADDVDIVMTDGIFSQAPGLPGNGQ